jgi:hypothetical protein
MFFLIEQRRFAELAAPSESLADHLLALGPKSLGAHRIDCVGDSPCS